MDKSGRKICCSVNSAIPLGLYFLDPELYLNGKLFKVTGFGLSGLTSLCPRNTHCTKSTQKSAASQHHPSETFLNRECLLDIFPPFTETRTQP